MSISPPRIRFDFWLRLDKKDEVDIADQIELLKNKRSFTKTIRDGIRLICDLRAGNTDVLFELFPHLEAKFSPAGRDNGAELERLERIEQLLAAGGYRPERQRPEYASSKAEKAEVEEVQLEAGEANRNLLKSVAAFF